MKKPVYLLLFSVLVFCLAGCEWFSPTDTGDNSNSSKPQTVSVNAISVSPTNIALKVGNTQTLTVTFDPTSATDKTVTWSSSGLDVANVDANGVVTAVSPGGAVITATSNDGSKTAACMVTVSNP